MACCSSIYSRVNEGGRRARMSSCFLDIGTGEVQIRSTIDRSWSLYFLMSEDSLQT